MTLRGMVGDEIKNDLEPLLMGRAHQPVKVVKRSEQWTDVAIVADVIAEVSHRRRIEGRDPECVDTEPSKIAETLVYPGQVADAVAVCVLKGARIDLID